MMRNASATSKQHNPGRRVATILAMLAASVGLLAAVPNPAHADPAAASLIRSWSDQLGSAQYAKPIILTCTQGGGSYYGSTVSIYSSVWVTRQADGSLQGGGPVYSSDRRTSTWPSQPFDATRTDSSVFTLTLSGELVEHSNTWGFTQTFELQALGNGMLGGWGGSIGNTGAPCFWVIGAVPGIYLIPQ